MSTALFSSEEAASGLRISHDFGSSRELLREDERMPAASNSAASTWSKLVPKLVPNSCDPVSDEEAQGLTGNVTIPNADEESKGFTDSKGSSASHFSSFSATSHDDALGDPLPVTSRSSMKDSASHSKVRVPKMSCVTIVVTLPNDC
jgi:hypothetical protein